MKVLLSGMGADELFGGYRKHLACVMAAPLPAAARRCCGTVVIGPTVDRLPVAVGGRGLRYARWAKRFVTFADLPEETAFRRSYTIYDGDRAGRPARPGPGSRTSTKLLDEHADIYDDTTLDDHVNRMCLADSRMFLPGLNLAYTDRSSMAASTEVRVAVRRPRSSPQAAFSIPGSEKIHRRVRARSR